MRKKTRILSGTLNESRFAIIVLMIMLTISLFMTLYFNAYVNYLAYDSLFLEDAELDDLYYVMDARDISLIKNKIFNEPIITENDNIENVYFTTILYYGDAQIIVVDEKLTESFPAFKACGIDLSLIKNDNDMIGLSPTSRGFFSNEFNVVGYARPPYKMFIMNSGTNGMLPLEFIFDSFYSGQVFISKDSETIRQKYGDKMSLSRHFIIEFKNDTTDEQKTQIIDELSSYSCRIYSFNEIKEDTSNLYFSTLRENMPMPLFLLGVSTIAYFSMLVLIFKKKEKDFAIFYVCGCSKKRILAIVAANCFIMVLPALILNTLFLMLFQIIIQNLNIRYVIELYINGYSYLTLFSYLVITVLIAATTTLVNMKKYSPIEFLKGVSE